MTDLNSVVLVGRLVRDAEVSYMQSGTAVGKVSVAVNRSYKSNEQWADEASFFDITMFGKLAENLRKYLEKGTRVAVQGSLRQERWTAKDGGTRSRVVIIADTVQLLDGRKEKGEESTAEPTTEFPEDIPYQQEDIPF